MLNDVGFWMVIEIQCKCRGISAFKACLRDLISRGLELVYRDNQTRCSYKCKYKFGFCYLGGTRSQLSFDSRRLRWPVRARKNINSPLRKKRIFVFRKKKDPITIYIQRMRFFLKSWYVYNCGLSARQGLARKLMSRSVRTCGVIAHTILHCTPKWDEAHVSPHYHAYSIMAYCAATPTR